MLSRLVCSSNPMVYGSNSLGVLVNLFNTVYLLLAGTAVALLVTSAVVLVDIHSVRSSSVVIQQPVLEVLWTLVPCVVILVGTTHSLAALYTLDGGSVVLDHVAHVVGNQWYWTVSSGVDACSSGVVDSRCVLSSVLSDGAPRLGVSDQPLYLPVSGSTLVVSSSDVLHCVSIPSLGCKVDAIPGRLNTTVVQGACVGAYSGYCNELCGAGHAFMPITVAVYDPTSVLQSVCDGLSILGTATSVLVGNSVDLPVGLLVRGTPVQATRSHVRHYRRPTNRIGSERNIYQAILWRVWTYKRWYQVDVDWLYERGMGAEIKYLAVAVGDRKVLKKVYEEWDQLLERRKEWLRKSDADGRIMPFEHTLEHSLYYRDLLVDVPLAIKYALTSKRKS